MRIPFIKFFREVWSETAKVTWPSRNQTIKLTIIVLVVTFAVSLYVFGLDVAFEYLFKILVTK